MVSPASGVRSLIGFFPKNKVVKLVSAFNGVRLLIWLQFMNSSVKLVICHKGLMSLSVNFIHAKSIFVNDVLYRRFFIVMISTGCSDGNTGVDAEQDAGGDRGLFIFKYRPCNFFAQNRRIFRFG